VMLTPDVMGETAARVEPCTKGRSEVAVSVDTRTAAIDPVAVMVAVRSLREAVLPCVFVTVYVEAVVQRPKTRGAQAETVTPDAPDTGDVVVLTVAVTVPVPRVVALAGEAEEYPALVALNDVVVGAGLAATTQSVFQKAGTPAAAPAPTPAIVTVCPATKPGDDAEAKLMVATKLTSSTATVVIVAVTSAVADLITDPTWNGPPAVSVRVVTGPALTVK
jgi:hypothetical protein